MGWSLFLPLASGDAHYMAALRVPLADTDIEFDAQILALAKIMVDSLNESALGNACPAAAELEGSISRYEQYGKANALPELESHVSTLQAIQALRSSSVAHRKGSRFTSVKSKLGFDSVDRITAFEQILRSATRMLVSISAHLRTLAPGAGSVASDP